MPPKKANEESHIKLKRAKSTTFLTVTTPASPDQVKSALLAVLRATPTGTHTSIDGQNLDLASLSSHEIELGIQSRAQKAGTPSTQAGIEVIDPAESLSSKVVLWRVKGEEFHVEEYPEDDENTDGA